MGDFYDDLATLISSICVEADERFLLCGDLNCPGSGGQINDMLTDTFNTYGLRQYVEVPTRGENILDVLAADDHTTVYDVQVSDAGLISDHKLILCKIMTSCQRQPVCHVFRNIKAVDPLTFSDLLIDSDLFVAPAKNADDFAEQLKRIVACALDKIAPIQTCYRRPSKPITRWLSTEAIQAKRERRRLERKWKSSGLEEDRQRYRRHCRATNKLINDSRSSYFRSQLESAENPRDRWRICQRLLHSKETVNCQLPTLRT